jgi:glycosyltransferase involved in cell wall biosynthesis
MLRRISPLSDLVALGRILRVLWKRDFDGVHAHTPKAGLLLTIAAWVMRMPVRIYHVHGLPWRHCVGMRGVLLRMSEHVACALATRVLCVSGSVRHALVREGMCQGSKCEVPAGGSSNGIDATERFVPCNAAHDAAAMEVRANHRIPVGAPVAGFIGRLANDKGLTELVEAWPLVRAAIPGAHLLVVGPPDESDPLPRAVQERLESDPSIHLHGVDWNSPPIYRAIDLLVLPTYREGFPNVLLEAGATATPVVATVVDGCVDAIVDGVTGTLVPARDAPALAAAMCTYLADSALRGRVGRAARKRVLAVYSRHALWSALHRIYGRCFSMPPRVKETTPEADTRSDSPDDLAPAESLAASGSCPTEHTSSVPSTS